MKALALAAISIYQRYISPHKGFCCAYRVHTGFSSCSALGFRAIRRLGVLRGVKALRQRLDLCRVAHGRLATTRLRPPASQRGDCDIVSPIGCACDAASCLGDGCGRWPGKKDLRHRILDDKVHLPKRGKR